MPPSNNLTSSSRHISHGHYRVTDREAGELARSVGKKLPKPGYELSVEVGGKTAWLARTPVTRAAAKRGWVWAIRPVDPLPAWARGEEESRRRLRLERLPREGSVSTLTRGDRDLIVAIGRAHARDGLVTEPATACARIFSRTRESYLTLPAELRAQMESTYEKAAEQS